METKEILQLIVLVLAVFFTMPVVTLLFKILTKFIISTFFPPKYITFRIKRLDKSSEEVKVKSDDAIKMIELLNKGAVIEQ